MSDLCVRCLIQKHREMETSLMDLESLVSDALGAEAGQPSADRVLSVTGQFASQVNGLLRAKEEVLFPALDRFLSSDTGPLVVLRSEHANLRALVASMRRHAKSLSGGNGGAPDWEQFRKDGRNALAIIRNQIYKEDRVFFPMVTRLLAPELDALLAERIARIDGQRRPRMKAKVNGAAGMQVGEEKAFLRNAHARIELANAPARETPR
jgi:hemerythrin-like domain-containing protein